MYAIIKAGGKQYTVKPGDVLRVEKLEAELGAELNLTEILMVGGEKTFIGENAGKAVVTVVVTNQQRGPKVIVFKKKRRQGYRRMGGHRQPYTELFVKSITSPEGQTVNADAQPQVHNPEKKAARVAKTKELRAQKKAAPRSAAAPEPKAKAPARKKVARKAVGKKPAAKKKTVKKAAGKKTATTKKAKK
ncbi:MAG: 50S ribosomal protein L21 [Bdellovibrionales bacterium]